MDYRQKTDYAEEPSITELEDLYDALQTLPNPPDNLIRDLLPRIVTADNRSGKRNGQLLKSVIQDIERAREFKSKADSILLPSFDRDPDIEKPILTACINELNPLALSIPLNELEELVIAAEQALQQFERLLSRATYAFVPIDTRTLEKVDARIGITTPLSLFSQPIRSISEGA
jgi:hypothetical protein